MENLSTTSFMLVGSDLVTSQSFISASEPILVILDNKLIKASNIVSPQLKLAGLNGPASLGELVVLEAQLTGECPQFIKNAKITWSVTEKGQPKQCWNDGKKIIFGAGVNPTTITVTATLHLNYTVGSETVLKTVTAVQTVQVGNIPNPNPPTPNSGIGSLVALWARDPSVVPVDALRGAQILSINFKKVSQDIGKEGLVAVKDILVRTKSSNNEALIAAGVDPRNWDNWGKNLQSYLYNEYVAKTLVTVEHFRKTWYDISTGLWGVK